MQLHNDLVPDDKVWAVRSSYASDPSNQFLDWFITAEAATLRYRDVLDYLKRGTGGEVSRWLVQLPRQGMESYDVHEFVYQHVIIAGDATRLDVYSDAGATNGRKP